MLVLAKNLDHDEELVAATTGNNAPRFAEWESSQASRDPLDKCYKEKKSHQDVATLTTRFI